MSVWLPEDFTVGFGTCHLSYPVTMSLLFLLRGSGLGSHVFRPIHTMLMPSVPRHSGGHKQFLGYFVLCDWGTQKSADKAGLSSSFTS